MKVLVTGCAGFVAGVVGGKFAASGHSVVGTTRSPAASWPHPVVVADLLTQDIAALVRDIQPDLVFHGAGSANVAASLQDPDKDRVQSVETWARLLDGVRKSGLHPRVIFPSSAAVYGNPLSLPVGEAAPLQPISPYGFHKKMCEDLAVEYRDIFGVETLTVRMFSLLGRGQRRLLAWDIFQQLKRGATAVQLLGSSQGSRDYLDVDDLAIALISLARHAAPPAVVNVASGVETPLATLAGLVARAMGSAAPVTFSGTARAGDPVRWCADTQRLRLALPNWAPRALETSVAQCVSAWNAGQP